MTTGASAAAVSHDERLSPEIKRVAVVVVLGTIMAILDTTIVAVALDTLAKDFKVSVDTIQWVTTGYLLAIAVVIPLSGWAVHRFGAKPTYMVSLALFVIGSAACGLAWSATALIGFRVLQGFGGGMIMPVGQTIMARTAGPNRMTRVMALIGVPTLLGPILGPVFGGFIVSNTTWRWIFFVNIPIGIVALILAARQLPTTPRDPNHHLDVPGFVFLSIGLALLVYGLSRIGTTGSFSSSSVTISLGIAAAMIGAFVVWSLRSSEPLVDLRLFLRRNFSVASICIFLTGATLYGNMFLLPLYYQVGRGQSAWVAGLLMAPQGIGAALVMQRAAKLSDRFGTRRAVPFGMALLALGTLAYTQVSATSSFAWLAVALFVRGIGLGFAMMPVFAASYRGLTHAEIPGASTLTNILRQVGGSIGVAVIAVVLQQSITHQFFPRKVSLGGINATNLPMDIVDKLCSAFATSFWWSFAIGAIAIIPAFFLPGPVPKEVAIERELEDAEIASFDEVAQVIPD